MGRCNPPSRGAGEGAELIERLGPPAAPPRPPSHPSPPAPRPPLPQLEGTAHTLDLLPSLLARAATPHTLTPTGGDALDEIRDGEAGVSYAEHVVKKVIGARWTAGLGLKVSCQPKINIGMDTDAGSGQARCQPKINI